MSVSICNIICRELTDISILNCFIHLRYVDLSKNNLRDISSLNALTHVLTLKAEHNKLSSARLEELPYLQVASFNNNRIKTTEGINHPLLEQLCLNGKSWSIIVWRCYNMEFVEKYIISTSKVVLQIKTWVEIVAYVLMGKRVCVLIAVFLLVFSRLTGGGRVVFSPINIDQPSSISVNEIHSISGLDPDKLTRLHTLELRGNKLKTTAGLYLPNLKNLFLVSFLNT